MDSGNHDHKINDSPSSSPSPSSSLSPVSNRGGEGIVGDGTVPAGDLSGQTGVENVAAGSNPVSPPQCHLVVMV